MTAAALLIHGYHPYAEDAEIYLPGVLKILNPRLFPVSTEFFSAHAGHTLYPNLIAFSVRASHMPLPWAALLWHIVSIFLLLAASWRLAEALFSSEPREDRWAQWAAVALMAALLTLPIAGTYLYILDQFLNPRNLAAFAALFAVAEVLHRKLARAAAWLGFGLAMHPLMASYAVLFCGWLIVLDRSRPRMLGFAASLPFGLTLEPPSAAYHEVALRQRSHFVLRWEWYEWVGAIAPVVLLWWMAGFAGRRGMKNLELVSRAMTLFVVAATVAAIGLGIPARFEALTRIQPLRCLALCYMVLIVAGGGLLGKYVLQNRVWRWVLLFVPLSLGMWYAQRQIFPSSQHLEWPWAQPRNLWAQAFEWIRANTPEDALFALNPDHMELPGEDENGFRARAERAMLADVVKDKGAASMFPPLAVTWAQQVADEKDFSHFDKRDFARLRQKYGVSWIVVQQPGPPGLECPYENAAVRVCRLG